MSEERSAQRTTDGVGAARTKVERAEDYGRGRRRARKKDHGRRERGEDHGRGAERLRTGCAWRGGEKERIGEGRGRAAPC